MVWALAVAAAAGGALAGTHPTGTSGLDQVYGAAFCGLLTLASARATRATWLSLTAVAVAMSRSWLLVPAVAGLGVAFASTWSRRRRRRVGGLIGALASQVVLRWPHLGFQGFDTVVGVVAVLPCLVAAYSYLNQRERRRVQLTLGSVAVLAVLCVVPTVVGALMARNPVSTGIADTRAALASEANAAAGVGSLQLSSASQEFAKASSRTGGWWTDGAALVPILSQQHRALKAATTAARDLTDSARAEEPAINFRDLGYHNGQLDLNRVRALAGPVDRLDRQLATAEHQVDSVRSSWLIQPVRSRVVSLGTEITSAHRTVDLANRAVAVAPALLGGDGTRHYFVAFDTPAESRGLGGFIGAFGELTVSQGRITLTRSGHTAVDLNMAANGQRHISGPPAYLARYGAFAPQDNFEDLTYAPDLPTVAQVIAQMYPQSGGDPIDGVMVLDPEGLASLLNFTGPISVPGLAVPLSTANAAEVLLKTQYLEFSGGGQAEIDRHDFLQAALKVAFDKLTTGSLPSPRTLSAVLDPAVRQGRLLFWSSHPTEEPLLRQVRLAGAFPARAGGDLLAVTTQNAANNKIDAYQSRTVHDAVTFNPATGRTDATVTVALHNTAPPSGLPPDVIGSYPGSGLPGGTNLTWLSIYSPLAFAGGTEGNGPLSVTSTPELGVNTYSAFVDIPPGATVTVVLHLDGTLERSRSYRLVVHGQPVVVPDQDTVDVRPAAGWRLPRPGSWSPGPQMDQSHAFSLVPIS